MVEIFMKLPAIHIIDISSIGRDNNIFNKIFLMFKKHLKIYNN